MKFSDFLEENFENRVINVDDIKCKSYILNDRYSIIIEIERPGYSLDDLVYKYFIYDKVNNNATDLNDIYSEYKKSVDVKDYSLFIDYLKNIFKRSDVINKRLVKLKDDIDDYFLNLDLYIQKPYDIKIITSTYNNINDIILDNNLDFKFSWIYIPKISPRFRVFIVSKDKDNVLNNKDYEHISPIIRNIEKKSYVKKVQIKKDLLSINKIKRITIDILLDL